MAARMASERNDTLNSARHPFGLYFWFAYAANTTLMIGVSALFRYADFVTSLGGDEYELGWIVGIGMLGAIAMRIFQGVGIDRYGAGNIWIVSVALVCVSLFAHTQVSSLNTPLVFMARILYTTSLAGAFGASITFVSSRAPDGRTGEMIGALGGRGARAVPLVATSCDVLDSGGLVDPTHKNTRPNFWHTCEIVKNK